jgi:hypothetical protein
LLLTGRPRHRKPTGDVRGSAHTSCRRAASSPCSAALTFAEAPIRLVAVPTQCGHQVARVPTPSSMAGSGAPDDGARGTTQPVLGLLVPRQMFVSREVV